MDTPPQVAVTGLSVPVPCPYPTPTRMAVLAATVVMEKLSGFVLLAAPDEDGPTASKATAMIASRR
jgi:hypothetical protein